MNGRVLLDTNAIINALNRGIVLPSGKYAISIITEMELFSFPKLTQNERREIERLLDYFEVINISQAIKEQAIAIRRQHRIKLPDSIICATAIEWKSAIVSDDKQLAQISNLDMLSLEQFLP